MPLEQMQLWIAHYGYAAIFCLLMLGIVGLPIPDETLLALTGYLVFRGSLLPLPSFLCAFLGTVCGISLSYAIGRIGGVRFLRRYGPRIHVPRERIDRVNNWFRHRGHWSLTVGYFIPGVRHVIAIVAGSSGVTFDTFALFAYGGALLWSATFIGAGYYLGEGWAIFPDLMRRVAIGLGTLALLGFGIYWLVRTQGGKKKR